MTLSKLYFIQKIHAAYLSLLKGRANKINFSASTHFSTQFFLLNAMNYLNSKEIQCLQMVLLKLSYYHSIRYSVKQTIISEKRAAQCEGKVHVNGCCWFTFTNKINTVTQLTNFQQIKKCILKQSTNLTHQLACLLKVLNIFL